MRNTNLFFFIVLFLMSFLIACASPPQPSEQAPVAVEKPANDQPAGEVPKIEEKVDDKAKVDEPKKIINTPKTVTIAIKSFKFVPADVAVSAGDTVVWTNEDSAPHTVESSDNTLRSDELSKDDTFSYTFTKSGKYNYICGIHNSMKGSVTVQ